MTNPVSAPVARSRSGFDAPVSFRLLASLFALLLIAAGPVRAVQLLPGVYGYGTDRGINSAGFGSTTVNAVILHVTNLSDRDASGATVTGSLRDMVTRSTSGAPRVIVFDVSGTIQITKWLKITQSNVTIAGQAAPGPVVIAGAPFIVGTGVTNVLVQHLRVRPGDLWGKLHTDNVTFNRDAVTVEDGAKNVVFDHCTFAWSLDELAEGYNAYENVTFNRCLFTEPLFIDTHLDEHTFDPNYPQQAEELSPVQTGIAASPAMETITGATAAVDSKYHKVNADGAGDTVTYTIAIPTSGDANNNRNENHIVVTGIKGPGRGKFRAEVYLGGSGTPIQASEEFDMYASTEATESFTFVSRHATPTTEFSLGPDPTTMTVKLVVTGKNASSSGYKLYVDQILLSQPHAMGPYFTGGGTVGGLPGGKLSFIGCVFSHLQARGPWVGSRNVVLANNIFYNREQQFVMFGVTTGGPVMNGYIVGNTFIEGPDWSNTLNPVKKTKMPSGSLVRLVDNTYYSGMASGAPALTDLTNNATVPTSTDDGMSGFTPLSATAAYESVFLDAGAWATRRDEIENRASNDILAAPGIADFASRPGGLQDSMALAGVTPPPAGSATWVPPGSPNAFTGSYTNLEIALQRQAGLASGSPTPGAVQAETGTLGGGTLLEATNLGKVGSYYVNFLVGSTGTPSTLTFSTINGNGGGTKTLRIRYALGGTGGARTGQLVVNGVTQSITFNPTGAFNTWANKDVTVTLNNNSTNSIVFKAIGADLANIDEISVY